VLALDVDCVPIRNSAESRVPNLQSRVG
jgi:hypothetical protein